MLTKPTTFSFIPQNYQNDFLCLCHSGTDTCRPGVSFGPAVRNVYMIHYITAGRGTYNVDNRQHHLGPGDAFLIRPGETGELFESGNADQLAQKIMALWQDSARLRRYGENCRDCLFPTPEQYCEQLEGLYH